VWLLKRPLSPLRNDCPRNGVTTIGHTVPLSGQVREDESHMNAPKSTSRVHPLSSVRGRIIVGFGLLVIVLVAVVACSAWLARKHQSDLAEMENYTAIADLLQDAQIASGTTATFLYGYVTTGNEDLLPTIHSSLVTSDGNISEALARERARHGELVGDLAAISSARSTLTAGTHEMVALAQAGDVEAATTMLEATAPGYNEWVLQLTAAVKYEQQQASTLKSRADRAGDLAFWLLVISGAIGASFGLVASIFIARSILKPLSSLESTARAVAAGNMDARCDARGPRELEHLGETLNSMIATVQQRTDELQSANEEMRERNRQLLEARTQAATDALTGLGNHRAFHLVVEEYIRKAAETGSRIGLVMLDVDGFKGINDSLGHLVGDEILREVARALIEAVGQDKAYRYGGDEFVVLLPDADAREAVEKAEELRQAVATRTDDNGNLITASLGVASFPDTATSAEELVYRADAAMYWAKSKGKNQVGNWHDLASASGSEVKTTETERRRRAGTSRVPTPGGR